MSASTTSYVIDQPTFLLTIGSASTGLNSAVATVSMRNQDPAVDGIYLNSGPLVGGGNLGFDYSDCNGSSFNSSNPLTNVGMWSGPFYCVFNFVVAGPGVFLDLNLLTFSISLPTTGTPVCFGDGSSTACPCGNNSTVGSSSGCLNSLTLGGKLLALGAASIGGDTLVLNASNITGPGLFFQANALSGPVPQFGDGLLCAGVGIIRLGVVFPTANAAAYPGGLTPNPISVGGAPIAAGDTKFYQCWYRDAAAFCTPATFNLTSALSITWGA